MKATMEEYGFIVVYTIVGIMVLALLFGLMFGTDDESLQSIMPKNAEEHKSTGDYSEYNNGLPILTTAQRVEFDVDENTEGIDLLSDELVTLATDANGLDLTDKVYVSRIVDVETGEIIDGIPEDKTGTYDVTYIVLDGENQRVKSKTRIIVNSFTSVDEDEEEEP